MFVRQMFEIHSWGRFPIARLMCFIPFSETNILCGTSDHENPMRRVLNDYARPNFVKEPSLPTLKCSFYCLFFNESLIVKVSEMQNGKLPSSCYF